MLAIDRDCCRGIIMAVREGRAGDLSAGVAEQTRQPVDSRSVSFCAGAVIPMSEYVFTISKALRPCAI